MKPIYLSTNIEKYKGILPETLEDYVPSIGDYVVVLNVIDDKMFSEMGYPKFLEVQEVWHQKERIDVSLGYSKDYKMMNPTNFKVGVEFKYKGNEGSENYDKVDKVVKVEGDIVQSKLKRFNRLMDYTKFCERV